MRRIAAIGAGVAMALGLVLSAPNDVEAQELHVGGQASYGTEDFSELGVGVRGTYLLTDVIAGAADFNYHFPGEGLTFWDLNINGHYHFDLNGGVTPYAGAGINYSNLSVDLDFGEFGDFGSASTSEVGINVLGGVFTDLDNGVRLYGEGRFVISDADQLVLTVGAGFPLGG